jgi:hypothetical protein
MPLCGRSGELQILFDVPSGRCDAIGQHLRVADLVGQKQDKPGVEQLGLLARQVRVGVQQLLVEEVGVLKMKFGFHGRSF